MENARQLDVNLYRRVPGDTVMISAKRGGETLVVPVVVVERPEDPDRFLLSVTPERNLIPRLGALALEIDDELRRSLGPLRGAEGVLSPRDPRRRPSPGTSCGPATSSTR